MKIPLAVLLMICLGEVRVTPAMKLDLLIHLSLKKGGALPPQTGDYLQDSFRQQSLIPAFSAVEEELKQLIFWRELLKAQREKNKEYKVRFYFRQQLH